jgi:glutamyl-tRNA reductase
LTPSSGSLESHVREQVSVEPRAASTEKEAPLRAPSGRTSPVSALRVVGLSHRTAPLELRERFALDRASQKSALLRALEQGVAREALLLSTCNRVELYADGPFDVLGRFFAEATQAPPAELEKCLYRYEGTEALAHLFRVSASLDSLVLGEDQILNQVKSAYALAHETGTLGGLLHASFQAAIKAGKRIRRETKIGDHMLSVSSVAVDFVQKVFSDLASRSVLLLGAGDAARLALIHLRARGVTTVRVANRSLENARTLAQELGAEAVSLADLAAEVQRADVVITSVGAPAPLVTAPLVQKALKARHGRSIFFLDIAIPRDVEPAVEKLSGAFLYNMDDLQRIVQENYGKRLEDIDAAMRMVSEEVELFLGAERHRALAPLVSEVLARMDQTARAEVTATLERLGTLPPEARGEVEALAERIVRRLFHAPLTAIREDARTSDDAGAQRLLERVLAHLPESFPKLPEGPGASA